MEEIDSKKLWSEFSNVSVNADDGIEQDFYFWKKGASRAIIWKWFNSHLPYGIMYQKFSVIQLELLWNELSNISINDNGEIESDFYSWEKGTFNVEIWHWFDEKLRDGLGKWLGV
ncbi:MAG: hypothetical protein ABIP35_05315 [Ginsengibacter sp.]